MVSYINFFIAAAVLTTVLGENYNIIRPIIGPHDYFKIAQTGLLYKIEIAEMENDAIDVRFQNRLAVIELQQQQILRETKQFVPYQSAKEQYKKCNNKAQNDESNLIFSAKSLTQSARDYATKTLSQRLAYCELYVDNQTKFENCYIEDVEAAVEYVQINLDKAQANREQIIFDMNAISLSAVQCSFNVEKVVLGTIAREYK